MSVLGKTIVAMEKIPLLGKIVVGFERSIYFRYVSKVREDAGGRAFATTAGTIRQGLFAGMRIDAQTSWGQDRYSTIAGQYEKELHPMLRRASELHYDCYVDIGCANGLYAVGLAHVDRSATVFAYDIDPAARAATERNAALNGVAARVTIGAEADQPALAGIITDHASTLIISDIEGGELDLVDPVACPALLAADWLIELHNDIPAAILTFADRFGSTHAVYVVSRSSRSPFADDCISFPSEDEAWIAVSEGRGFAPQNWLFVVRKAKMPEYADILDEAHWIAPSIGAVVPVAPTKTLAPALADSVVV